MAAKIKEMVPESEKKDVVSVDGVIGWILKKLGFTTGIGLLGWGGFWFIYNMVLYIVTNPVKLISGVTNISDSYSAFQMASKLNMSNALMVANQTIETYFTQSLLGIIIAAFGMVIMYQKRSLEMSAGEHVPATKTSRKK